MEKQSNMLKIPHDCYIILTSKCNLRCIHCYGNYGEEGTDNELTGEEWNQVFADLVKENVFFVNISGGEPTCHKDFPEIMRALKQHQLHYILTTNGICSVESLNSIEETRDLLIGLKVSLDGPDAWSHSYLRRGINGERKAYFFLRTMSTIDFFSAGRIPFTIASCIHPENINKMEEFLDLILRLKPVSWHISTISLSGRALDNLDGFSSETEADPKIWQKIERECTKHNIFVKFVDMPNHNGKEEVLTYYECPAAEWFCEINGDGLVTPCPLARVSMEGMSAGKQMINFENIRDKSIREIWTGNTFRQFRKLKRQGCEGCITKDKCGRCIPQSMQWFQDPLLPPPHCIKNGEMLKLEGLDQLSSLLDEKMSLYHRDNYI